MCKGTIFESEGAMFNCAVQSLQTQVEIPFDVVWTAILALNEKGAHFLQGEYLSSDAHLRS